MLVTPAAFHQLWTLSTLEKSSHLFLQLVIYQRQESNLSERWLGLETLHLRHLTNTRFLARAIFKAKQMRPNIKQDGIGWDGMVEQEGNIFCPPGFCLTEASSSFGSVSGQWPWQLCEHNVKFKNKVC